MEQTSDFPNQNNQFSRQRLIVEVALSQRQIPYFIAVFPVAAVISAGLIFTGSSVVRDR